MPFSRKATQSLTRPNPHAFKAVLIGWLVHAYWHEIVLDGVGDGCGAAVGERDRRPVGTEHGVEVDALQLVADGRKQSLSRLDVELLDVGDFAIAKLLQLAAAHRWPVNLFVLVHQLLSASSARARCACEGDPLTPLLVLPATAL